ncbi:hypothetical protein Tdes44962_MAKER08162 [Teratosphaeria destructans]|uniref:Uncharacterized protein n=1 Tax=Teratosphaeria destructans TaxID=418781 RepID=A0A9W7W4Z6_9PEZI|nr:hypothetical protein Tdes44962_MAKER08162 [Teratosphaeria destructans]
MARLGLGWPGRRDSLWLTPRSSSPGFHCSLLSRVEHSASGSRSSLIRLDKQCLARCIVSHSITRIIFTKAEPVIKEFFLTHITPRRRAISIASFTQPQIAPSSTAASSSIPAPPTAAAPSIVATSSPSVQTLPAGSGSSLPISLASSTLTTTASQRVGAVSTHLPRPYGNGTGGTSGTSGTNNTSTAAAARPASSGDGHSSKVSAVSVTIGVLGGLLAVILAALYYRRRRSWRPTIVSGANSPRDSQRAYPECAWLYDPQMTPQAGSTQSLPLPPQGSSSSAAQAVSSPAVPSRHTSVTYALFPSVSEPRPGTVELPSDTPSPPPAPRYLVSLLFGPEGAGARDRMDPAASAVSQGRNSYSPVSWEIRSASPGPSRSLRSACGSSMDLLQRPMSAIREEVCRGPDDGFKVQRYIQVPDRSSQRHSI